MNCKLFFRYYQVNILTKHTEFTNTSRSLKNSVEKGSTVSLVAMYPHTAIMEKEYRSLLKQLKQSNYMTQQSTTGYITKGNFISTLKGNLYSNVYWNCSSAEEWTKKYAQ